MHAANARSYALRVACCCCCCAATERRRPWTPPTTAPAAAPLPASPAIAPTAAPSAAPRAAPPDRAAGALAGLRRRGRGAGIDAALRLGPVVALLGILVLLLRGLALLRIHEDVGRQPGARQRERRRPRYHVLHDGFHACWDLLIVWLHRLRAAAQSAHAHAGWSRNQRTR